MLNEGLIVNDTTALIKSEMVKQIGRLGPTTPDDFEKAVFEALTGHNRSEIDWGVEDNHAGYHLWLKTFDQLVDELVDDGYIVVEEQEEGGQRRLVPTETLPHIEFSHLVYPPSGSD